MKLLFVFTALALNGCSWFNTTKSEVEIQPPPKVTHSAQAKPKKIKRELGSLWSDDSSWNQMYSPTQTRAPGDIVTIKLDKKFIAKMEQAIKRPDPEEVKGNEKEKESKKEGKKDKNSPKDNGGSMTDASNPDSVNRGPASQAAPAYKIPETVEVTILESLPRGVYRVAANHGFKPAADSPYVYIQGAIREREILADDTAPSDALLDLKFESINRDLKVSTFQEEDNQ